eukprot:8053026-Pyramimonas_sp.AAC.1
MNDRDRANLLFLRVRDNSKSDELSSRKRISWHIDGQEVCKSMWCHMNYIGRSKADEYRTLIDNGHTHIPEAMPKLPGVRSECRASQCGLWSDVAPSPSFEAGVGAGGHVDVEVAPFVGGAAGHRGRRSNGRRQRSGWPVRGGHMRGSGGKPPP